MRLVLLLLTGFSLLIAGLAWSADNPAPQDSGQEETQQPDSGDAQENPADADLVLDENDADAADEEDSPGRFIPTEEISQDLGVSFPVDI